MIVLLLPLTFEVLNSNGKEVNLMVHVQKFTRILAPTILVLMASVFAIPGANAASSTVRISLHNYCHRDGCDMKMTTNQENKIKVDTNAAFFTAQGMMKRHHHFLGFLPDVVYARELTIIDREAPGNTFNLTNDLTGPSSVNINEVTVNVSDSIFKQIEHNIFSSQNVGVEVNTGNNTMSFNTSLGNITTSDISISLR
jgi:hypothetical protein